MKIIVNGKPKDFSSAVSVANLLEDMQLADQRVAVEINLEVIPRSRYGQYQLQDNDRVEIVRAIGGG
ncbi:MAG: sulfur carrier protein ThiS [Gammaproteobacteria bacterium]|nr:sulfur carrier protein ThiS [Gammaproteobacteria bacterium]